MTRMIDMPSPRGTNYEGLTIPAHWVAPKLAYDAMPKSMRRRLADDQEGDPFDDLEEDTAYWLACELFRRFPGIQQKIRTFGTENSGTGADRKRANDQPLPFPGAPTTGTSATSLPPTRAHDSRILAHDNAVFRRYPDLKKIQFVGR